MPSAWSPKDIETATRAARREEARVEKVRALKARRAAEKAAKAAEAAEAAEAKPSKAVDPDPVEVSPASRQETTEPVAAPSAKPPLQPARMRLAMTVGADLRQRRTVPADKAPGDRASRDAPKTATPPRNWNVPGRADADEARPASPPVPPISGTAPATRPESLQPRRTPSPPPDPSAGRKTSEPVRRDVLDDPRELRRTFSADPFGGLY
jgi:hypothetical protein